MRFCNAKRSEDMANAEKEKKRIKFGRNIEKLIGKGKEPVNIMNNKIESVF